MPEAMRHRLIAFIRSPEDIKLIKTMIYDIDLQLRGVRDNPKLVYKTPMPLRVKSSWKTLAHKLGEQVPEWVDTATFGDVLTNVTTASTQARAGISTPWLMDDTQTDEEVFNRIFSFVWFMIAMLIVTTASVDEKDTSAFFAMYCSVPISLLALLGPNMRQVDDANDRAEREDREEFYRKRGYGYDPYWD